MSLGGTNPNTTLETVDESFHASLQRLAPLINDYECTGGLLPPDKIDAYMLRRRHLGGYSDRRGNDAYIERRKALLGAKWNTIVANVGEVLLKQQAKASLVRAQRAEDEEMRRFDDSESAPQEKGTHRGVNMKLRGRINAPTATVTCIEFGSRSRDFFAVGFEDGGPNGGACIVSIHDHGEDSIVQAPKSSEANGVASLSFSSRNNFLVCVSTMDQKINVYRVDKHTVSNKIIVDAVLLLNTIESPASRFPLEARFPPSTSDILEGCHDEIYFVLLSKDASGSGGGGGGGGGGGRGKLGGGASVIECVDCLKGEIVERCGSPGKKRLSLSRTGKSKTGINSAKNSRSIANSVGTSRTFAFGDCGRVIYFSLRDGTILKFDFDCEALNRGRTFFTNGRKLKSSLGVGRKEAVKKRLSGGLFSSGGGGGGGDGGADICEFTKFFYRRMDSSLVGITVAGNLQIVTINSAGAITSAKQPLPNFQKDGHSAVAISHSTNLICLGHHSGNTRLIDSNSENKFVCDLADHYERVRGLAWSFCGTRIATGDTRMVIYDLEEKSKAKT